MANADGSVIFSCDLDSTKAQKKLSKLRDEISELNSKLEKETGNKMNLEKQLDAASQAAKATEERVKMLRKEVERLNDREWIQKQGFTQSEYQAQVLDRRAAAEAELKQQEALLPHADEGGQNAFGCLRRDDRQHRQHDCKARQSKSRCR